MDKYKVSTTAETRGFFQSNGLDSNLGGLVRYNKRLYVITELFPYRETAIIEELPEEEQVFPVMELCHVIKNPSDFNITKL